SRTVPDTTATGDASIRRVLVVHNWHRFISGENRTVELDLQLLRASGIAVEMYERHNDELDDFGPLRWAGMALRPTISPADARALRRLIGHFRPDVVHLHNPMPLISPWVIRTARAAGVPVVQTVNNFLHVCAAGTYFRDGRICHDCRGRTLPWPSVAHACIQGSRVTGAVGSRLQTASIALSLTAHRSTWRLVDRFVAVGTGIARHLEQMGIDPIRISIRGNPVTDPGEPTPPGRDALFVGRLRAEKGAHLLLEAWKRSGLGRTHTLRIAGDGPDQERIKRASIGMVGVEILGAANTDRVDELMKHSGFVIVPSLWHEPFGLVAVEALARGRAVLTTTVGEPAHIVDPASGWVVEPTAEGLAAGLQTAFAADLQQ
ncbi:MAG: glycosyltransferase, partial [Actinomycetota bacterium]